MATGEDIEKRIIEYMKNEYYLTIPHSTVELIVRNGFEFTKPASRQYYICDTTQKKINGNSSNERIARVFLLALMMGYVDKHLSLHEKFWWANHLGIFEYKVGMDIPHKDGIINHTAKRLFEKSIEHLLIAEGYGIKKALIVEFLAKNYHKLEDYLSAKHYLLLARERGSNNKVIASLLGNCYFALGNFEEGIGEYENALEIAIKEKFDSFWMHAFDHFIFRSFKKFENAIRDTQKDSTEREYYINHLHKFKDFYDRFEEYAKKNYLAWKKDDIPYLKLRPIDRDGSQRDLLNMVILEFEADVNVKN